MHKMKILLYPAMAYIMAYTQRELQAFTILVVLIVIDFITGVVKSGIINGGHSITSKKARIGLLSKLSLLLVPLSIGLMFTGIGFDGTAFVSGVAGLFIVYETYSITGNVWSIVVGEEKMEYDAISAIFAFILGSLKKFLDKNLK